MSKIKDYNTSMENLFDLITKIVELRSEYADKFKQMKNEIIVQFK